MRGKSEIDLTVDPAPELVIEIDDTHSSLNKHTIFARIGVSEVWRWREGQITIYVLIAGTYESHERSRLFPSLTAQILTELVAKSRTLRRPDWVREVRTWARQNPLSQSLTPHF